MDPQQVRGDKIECMPLVVAPHLLRGPSRQNEDAKKDQRQSKKIIKNDNRKKIRLFIR